MSDDRWERPRRRDTEASVERPRPKYLTAPEPLTVAEREHARRKLDELRAAHFPR